MAENKPTPKHTDNAFFDKMWVALLVITQRIFSEGSIVGIKF